MALDADVLTAFLDAADPQHQASVELLRPRLAAGQQILLSARVYAEVMVGPVERGTEATVDEFLDAIRAIVVRSIARSPAGRPRSAANIEDSAFPTRSPSRRPSPTTPSC